MPRHRRMIELQTARNGRPTAVLRGRALHSTYDPDREALRFVERAVSTPPGTLVLLGAGLGYVSEEIRRRYPRTRIVAIYYEAEIHAQAWHRPPETWHPGSDLDLGSFLRATVGELDLEGLQVLEWEPSARACEAQSREANRTVLRHVNEVNASSVTTLAFGRLWIRNCIANYVCGSAPLAALPLPADRGALIAASGPSLEPLVPVLREVRSRATLVALPSALPLLFHAGLPPDLVVVTDPGFYTGIHTRELERAAIPVVMPLSAYRGLCSSSCPVHYLRQPLGFEEELLDAGRTPATRVPAFGTVAATALHLILRFLRGPAVFAGLDLGYDDVVSHARPNAFELWLRLDSRCTRPFHHLSFARAVDSSTREGPSRARTSRALTTYREWFASLPPADRERTLRLSPPEGLPAVPGVRVIRPRELQTLFPAAGPPPPLPPVCQSHPLRTARLAQVRRLLDGYRGLVTDAEGSGLAASPRLLSLAGVLAPRELLTVKRALRLHGKAQEETRLLLDGLAAILDGLAARIADEGAPDGLESAP